MNPFVILSVALLSAAAPDGDLMDHVQRQHDAYTLAPGPKVEGVVFLQGLWNAEILRAFHEVPWIDAASVRMRWADFEPQDQQFNWKLFDKVLGEVKACNAAHPGARRTLQIRAMGGEHAPKWFADKGVRMYETHCWPGPQAPTTVRVAIPFDNPEYLKQLREMYRAMYERYHDEPLVTVYHGTWSAGPWDEIFVPYANLPEPPGATPQKYIQGHVEQLDVLIDEFCMKEKVAELPYSGAYAKDKKYLDLTGPLTDRIVERLGRRSPFLYIQSNGWGYGNRSWPTIAWDHEQDIYDAYGKVNLALQAIGSNAGGRWIAQGDWIGNVRLAQQFECAYLELYSPDFGPLDTKNHIVEAMTQDECRDGFLGFRPWLQQARRVLYVREGIVRKTFRCGEKPRQVDRLLVVATVPPMTSVSARRGPG